MKYGIWEITIDPVAGCHISRAAEDALSLLEERVAYQAVIEFNGKRIPVHRGETVDEIVKRFEELPWPKEKKSWVNRLFGE